MSTSESNVDSVTFTGEAEQKRIVTITGIKIAQNFRSRPFNSITQEMRSDIGFMPQCFLFVDPNGKLRVSDMQIVTGESDNNLLDFNPVMVISAFPIEPNDSNTPSFQSLAYLRTIPLVAEMTTVKNGAPRITIMQGPITEDTMEELFNSLATYRAEGHPYTSTDDFYPELEKRGINVIKCSYQYGGYNLTTNDEISLRTGILPFKVEVPKATVPTA